MGKNIIMRLILGRIITICKVQGVLLIVWAVYFRHHAKIFVKKIYCLNTVVGVADVWWLWYDLSLVSHKYIEAFGLIGIVMVRDCYSYMLQLRDCAYSLKDKLLAKTSGCELLYLVNSKDWLENHALGPDHLKRMTSLLVMGLCSFL